MDSVLLESLNSQLNFERASAEIYEAMAIVLDDIDLTGMAKWMYAQAGEERTHAKKFSEYILDQNERPHLDEVPEPVIPEVENPMTMGQTFFVAALEHEKVVTSRINALFKQAREVGDNATEIFMQWFVTEQVEEERQIVTILNRFNLANDGAAILILDEEIGERK
jgi:ferritin